MESKVERIYNPPAGRIGAAIAWLSGSAPESELHEDLRIFKRLIETGSIRTAEGQLRGVCRAPA